MHKTKLTGQLLQSEMPVKVPIPGAVRGIEGEPLKLLENPLSVMLHGRRK